VTAAIRLAPEPGKSITLKTRTLSAKALSPVTEAVFTGETILKARPGPADAKSGTWYDYYEGEWDGVPEWNKLTPVKSGNTEFFHQGPRPVETKAWAARYRAWLKIPRTGRYRFWGFFMAQKGLVRLSIGDREIFSVAKASGQGRGEVVLEEGLHPVCAEVVESHSDGSKGNHYFFIGFSGPGIPETRLTDAYLVYVPEKP
jgi:hypothetical protein